MSGSLARRDPLIIFILSIVLKIGQNENIIIRIKTIQMVGQEKRLIYILKDILRILRGIILGNIISKTLSN